jgi:hypothetical protein
MVLFSGHGARKPHDRASIKLGVGSEPLSSNLQGPSRRPYILSRGKTLPLQLKRRVEEKLQAIRSEPTVFVKVMTPTDVDTTGTIPCYMVRLHILFFYISNYGTSSLICSSLLILY